MTRTAYHFVGDKLRDGRPIPANWDAACVAANVASAAASAAAWAVKREQFKQIVDAEFYRIQNTGR